MKNFYLLIAIFTSICLIQSCKTQEPVGSASVNYLSQQNGTITMRSIGSGKNKEDAIKDAEKNTINVLLFRGLPGSLQATRMVDMTESLAFSIHPTYFENLLNEDRYKTFVMSTIVVGDLMKGGGGLKKITIDIKVNINSLRRDLENHNIIRNFGY